MIKKHFLRKEISNKKVFEDEFSNEDFDFNEAFKENKDLKENMNLEENNEFENKEYKHIDEIIVDENAPRIQNEININRSWNKSKIDSIKIGKLKKFNFSSKIIQESNSENYEINHQDDDNNFDNKLMQNVDKYSENDLKEYFGNSKKIYKI